MLRYSLGNLKSWEIDIQQAIFRDMAVNIFDKQSRVQLVWNLFDDAGPLGKAILGKLFFVIDQYTKGKGLSFLSGMFWAELDLAEDDMGLQFSENLE